MPDVTVLFVNHNGGRTIHEAIRCVQRQTLPVKRILVVDNGSTDGSPAGIHELFPDVKVIGRQENQGPGRARNLGLSLAETELVLWVDDDIYLAPDCLEKMTAAYLETGAVAICPRIVFHPERDTIQFDGAAIHFCGVLSLLHANQPVGLTPERTFPNAFGSACLLVDRQVLAGLGGFDAHIFFYFEDLELAYRLRARGHVICCEAQAAAYHDRGQGSAALAFRGRGDYPVLRAYYLLRHRWLIVLMHYQLRTLCLLSPALALYEAMSFAVSLQRGWLWQWCKALISVAANAGRILRSRGQLQRTRRVRDRELLSAGPLPFSSGFVRSGIESGVVDLLNRVLNRYWESIRKWL